jgi:protein-S-isoprenylcysteine O-methyltransferase Ste14
VKDWIEGRLGILAKRGYRLAYNLIGVVTLLPVLAVPALNPGDVLYQLTGFPLAMGMTGQFLALVVLLIGVWQTGALQFLGLRQVLSPIPDSKPELTIEGLYRWVRHPLYTAGLLFIWLTPLMTSSLLALNIGLTAYIYIGSIFEEHRLVREFDQVYEQYQREVPRLFPRLWPRTRA